MSSDDQKYYGKQFFHYIYPRDGEQHLSYGNNLVNHLKKSGKNIRDKFIVAQDAPRSSGDGVGKRFFYFNSALDCYGWIQRIPLNERTFYEYTIGSRPQKPHFDVDSAWEMNEVQQRSADFEEYTNALLTAIHTTFQACGVYFRNHAEHYRVYDSSGPFEFKEKDPVTGIVVSTRTKYKLSRHIVITGIQHNNNEEAGAFYRLVSQELHTKIGGKNIDVFKLDNAVYSSGQEFRMLGSQKVGSNRIKTLLSTFAGAPIAVSSDIAQITEGFPRDYADFIDSLLDPVGNLVYEPFSHPSLVKPVNRNVDTTVYGYDEDPIALAHRLLEQNPEIGKMYSVGDFTNNLTRLNLRCPGRFECPCHGRKHDSNGAYITVDKAGRCLLRCWASGAQRPVVLGRVKITSENGVELAVTDEEEDEIAQSILSDPSSDIYKAFSREIKKLEERERLLTHCGEILNTWTARYLPNTTEMRYIELCEETIDAVAMGYQDMRGWIIPPNVGSVAGKFIRPGGWNVDPVPSPPPNEFFPTDTPVEQLSSGPASKDFWARYYQARAIKFYEVTYEICRYLTVNHKIRLMQLHCQEGSTYIILKNVDIPTLYFRFNKPEPLGPKDDPKRYPMGYKYVPDVEAAKNVIRYTVEELMAGVHFEHAAFCPLIRKRMQIKWAALRTRLTTSINTMPYLAGDPVPLRSYKDVNEFAGFQIKNLRKICAKYNNDYTKLRDDPLVARYLNHVRFTFANGDARKFNELISFLVYPLVMNGMKTGKILSIFGAKSAGKSLFWCSVVKAIYGAVASLGNKLKDLFEEFNSEFAGKMILVFDEATFTESKGQSNGDLINLLKNMATDPITKIRGLYAKKIDVDNYANPICLSNNPTSCNWIEYDPTNKRNLTYQTAVVGYDTSLNEYVTAMDGVFTTRTNPLTGQPSRSTQPGHLLLQNYYNCVDGVGLNMVKEMLDPNAIEHLAAYLYLYAKTPGSGFIDYANVTYNQPSEEIHAIVADGWTRKERRFIDAIISPDGYEWMGKVTPLYIQNSINAGFYYVERATLYEEFVLWNKRFCPGQNCIDSRKFIKAVGENPPNNFRVCDQTNGDTRCAKDGDQNKKHRAGYCFRQAELYLRDIDGVTPVMQNEFAKSLTQQPPTQSPHTAQFGPQPPQQIDPNLLKLLMTMTPEQQAMLVTNLDPNRGQQQQ